MKLYPPNGKGDPIIPHPSKIEEMIEKGWTKEQQQKVKPTKEIK